MRRIIQTLAVLAVTGLLGAAAVVGLGLYNVSAKVGHWPGVSWVLHTTFRNAVRLRAPAATEVPDLSDPALIELGARHYDIACAMCHAAPGEDRSATIRAMVPEPPHIAEAVAHWKPRHLHWIVENGVKMSGMPHWPARQRPDEIWPVVAYLAAVQDGMAGAAHGDLTAPAEVDGPWGAAYCSGCHGGVARHVPRLDILSEGQIMAALKAYRSGARQSGIMHQAASLPSEDALAELAAWYGAQQTKGSSKDGGDLARRGAELARAGTDDVPACTACHGPEASRADPSFPSLSGQDRPYLETQLSLWRDGTRNASELMRKAAQDLTDADIAALAAWYATLAPQRRGN